MTEVKELLDAQVPLRVEAQPDWADVLRRAGTNGVKLRASRRILIPALVVISVLMVGVAVAAALDAIPWWKGAPPPDDPSRAAMELARSGDFPASADRGRARTVARAGDGSSLVAAPIPTGGYCILPYFPREPGAGVQCVYGASEENEVHDYARPLSSGQPHWIVYGRILEGGARLLDLSPAAGFPLRVPLRHGGFFIANVPRDRWRALSGKAGPAKILDASGATVSTACITWGPGPTGPEQELTKYRFWRDDWRASKSQCKPEALPQLPTYKTADLSAARKLVELTLGASESIYKAGDTIAMWVAPGPGGVCVFTALASPLPGPTNLPGGGYCAAKMQEETFGGPIGVSFSAGLQGAVYRWMVTGFVKPESGIERLELRSADGNVPLGFENNHFLAQLPRTSNSGDELPPGGPYVLIGFDSNGNEVARVDLAEVEARFTTPPDGG